MNDQVKALIARLRDYPNGSLDPETRLEVADALEAAQPQGEYHEGLEEGIKIGRAEAAQQAPAVEREALARLLDPWAWEYGNPESPAVQMSRSVALAKADATIKSGVASGVLLDAAEVEARGLERLIERVTDDGLVQMFGGEKFVSVALLVSEVRAQQVREGKE